jgi:hypothetical protein
LDTWLPVVLLLAIAIAIAPRATFAFARSGRRPTLPPIPATLIAPTSRLADYAEGETTRLLQAVDPHGAYVPRSRFLDKPEGPLYFLIKAALPTHEVFARMRPADVLEVKVGPHGLDRLQTYRKIGQSLCGFRHLRQIDANRRGDRNRICAGQRKHASPKARPFQAGVHRSGRHTLPALSFPRTAAIQDAARAVGAMIELVLQGKWIDVASSPPGVQRTTRGLMRLALQCRGAAQR